jgi:RND superfamily putative drug exporter
VSGSIAGPRSSRHVWSRPRLVVGVAVAFLIAAIALGAGVFGNLLTGGMVDPGAASTEANYHLEQEFPGSRANAVLVLRSSGSVDSPELKTFGAALTNELSKTPGIGAALSYWSTTDPRLRGADGREALILISSEIEPAALDTTLDAARGRLAQADPGASLTLGGPAAVQQAIRDETERDLYRTELIAFPLTLLVLALVFRGLFAALLSLAMGGVAVVGTLAVLQVLTTMTPVSVFALNVCTALGLALTVDYSLLIVKRFREALALSDSVPDAIAQTMRTAGRTVAMSAVVVALSLASLLAFPQFFLRSIAYAGVAVVALTATATLVLLPALLLLVGRRIDGLDLFKRWRRSPDRPGRGGWRAWGERVIRWRIPVVVLTVGLLVLLAAPAAGLSFGTADDRQLPADNSASQVQQTLRDRFPAMVGTYDVVLHDVEADRDADALRDYAQRLSLVPGVQSVDFAGGVLSNGQQAAPATELSGKRFAKPGSTWLLVSTSLDPNSAAAQDLVPVLRDVSGPGRAQLGGAAAEIVDSKSAVADGLPWVLLIVAGSSAAILLLLTRGLLIPLKAVIVSFLSLGATLGVIVWVFQEGHLAWLVGGFQLSGYLDLNAVVLVLVVAFGLAMDYEMFLISRIAEEHRRGYGTAEAVVRGLERSGGTITAAAAVICVVLVGLASSSVLDLKLLGAGLTFAILLDAFLIRCLLVPAALLIAGEANWWSPWPLRRQGDRATATEQEAAELSR